MPFAKWKNFDDCLNDPDNKKRYPSLETRKKVCGSLQAKHEKDFDHKVIVEKYNKLKLEHPEFDERRLLEEVFSRMTKDFQEDYSHLIKLVEDVYVDGHAHIIYPLKDLTDEQIKAIFNAARELHKAGIYFDTGYNVEKDEREWLMDWSLKGAKIKVELKEDLKQKYYCKICKSHHFFDSDKGKEHLSMNQKTVKVHKVKIKETKTKFNIDKNLYREIQKETKETNDEQGYIISESGKTFKIKGIKNEIDPWEVRKINKNLSGNITFIHSHPSEDMPFSSSDIALFILSSKIRKVGVVTKNGTIYELEKPKSIEKYSFNDIDKAKNRYKNSLVRMLNKGLKIEEAFESTIKYFSDKYKYNLKYNKEKLKEDFSFPETMSKSVGEGKIVKPKEKNKKVKICEECKKEVESYFYKKLCEECYLKRVKHYIKVYDLEEDYPVSEHTREGGKIKIKAHTRGESHFSQMEKRNEAKKITEGKITKIATKIKIKDLDYFINAYQEKIKKIERKIKEIKKKEEKESNIININWDWERGGYADKWIFQKTNLMKLYEKETKKRVISKIIDEPISKSHNWTGKVQLTKGYLEWRKNKKGELTEEKIKQLKEEKKSINEKFKTLSWNSKEIIPLYNRLKRIEAELEFKEQDFIFQIHKYEEKSFDMILFDLAQEFDLIKDFVNLTEDEAIFELEYSLMIHSIHQPGSPESYFSNPSPSPDESKAERLNQPIRKVESHIPSGKTRLQELWELQKAYDKAVRLGKELGVTPNVSPVASITIPFSITNTESGKTMKGEVVENIDKNTTQLMPVSSSNVRASGQFKNELLVQFHPSKLQPMRTYRFMFETPEQANEANKSLTSSGSPGRWVWQNLRGHTAGEKVTSSKLGPSLSPPGQGLPTIGGTSASLVPYKISNRVPVQKVKNFDDILKEMKRTNPNLTLDPMTGSRIEALMGTRKELREMKEPSWRKGTHGLPPIGDFVYVGNINDLIEEDYKVRGHWRHLKFGKKIWIEAYERGDPSKHVVWIGGKKKIIETPLWKRIKNKRKEFDKLNEQIEEMYLKGIPFDASKAEEENIRKGRDLLSVKINKLRQELKIPSRKSIEQSIKSAEESIEWAEERKIEDKKQIEQELSLEAKMGYKPNFIDDEWNMFLELYKKWDEGIKYKKEYIEEFKKELKKIEEFEKELFEDKTTIKHTFDITLHKKLKIQRGLIKRYPYLAEDKINTINNAFYDLPRHLQNSCKQIRIFEEANDDPLFGQLKSCGGFYSSSEETITIGLKTDRKEIFGYSDKFLNETTVHEAAHALDFTSLTAEERYDAIEFFNMNYERLNNRGEYAATNRIEFFAEGYTKLYTGNHNWFRGLKKGTKKYFQDIMKKYDFIIDSIMIDLNEKINGIKFSYQDGDNHIFGVYRIPEDITFGEADELVKEGKAQYENIDKYFKKEKEVDKNDKKID